MKVLKYQVEDLGFLSSKHEKYDSQILMLSLKHLNLQRTYHEYNNKVLTSSSYFLVHKCLELSGDWGVGPRVVAPRGEDYGIREGFTSLQVLVEARVRPFSITLYLPLETVSHRASNQWLALAARPSGELALRILLTSSRNDELTGVHSSAQHLHG